MLNRHRNRKWYPEASSSPTALTSLWPRRRLFSGQERCQVPGLVLKDSKEAWLLHIPFLYQFIHMVLGAGFQVAQTSLDLDMIFIFI